MQNNNFIKQHPLYSLAWDMLHIAEQTEGYNHCYVVDWLSGPKEYFNGLSPLQMWDDDQKEVIDWIDEMGRGKF